MLNLVWEAPGAPKSSQNQLSNEFKKRFVFKSDVKTCFLIFMRSFDPKS